MPENKNNYPIDKLSNYSIDFNNALTNKIVCGDAVAYSTFTLSAWANPSSPASYAAIFGSRNGIGAFAYLLSTDNTNKFRFTVDDGSSKSIYSDSTFSNDTWYNIVCVADGTNIKMYVNGTLQADTDTYGTLVTPTDKLMIGAQYETDTQYEWSGKISQVCLFDYALTDGTGGTVNQIEYLYNLNNPMAISGEKPIAYWPLSDNSNPTASAGYPNISVEADSVFDFDSSGQRINLGLESNLNLGGSSKSSTSLWFKKVANSTSCLYGYNYGDANGSGFYFWLNSGALRVAVGKDGETSGFGYYQISSSNLPIGEWINIIVVFDGTLASGDDRIKVYQNGEVATGTYTNGTNFPATLPTGNGASNRNVYLGQLQLGNGGFSYNYDGEMSNVQQWDTDLDLSDSVVIYNNGQPLMTGAQPKEANLRAWYKLNQTANWEADTVGNWQIPDNRSAYPQSFEFKSSVNEQIDLGTNLDFTSAMTFTAWVKVDTTHHINDSLTFVSNVNGAPNIKYNFRYYQASGNKFFRLQLWANNGVVKNYNTYANNNGAPNYPNISDNKWHLVGFSCDGTTDADGIRMYVDEQSWHFTADNPGIQSSTLDTRLGVYQNNAATWDFAGEMSNAQFWDTNLSDANIVTLYNNGIPLTTALESSNLKAWYKLDNNNSLWNGSKWEFINSAN